MPSKSIAPIPPEETVSSVVVAAARTIKNRAESSQNPPRFLWTLVGYLTTVCFLRKLSSIQTTPIETEDLAAVTKMVEEIRGGITKTGASHEKADEILRVIGLWAIDYALAREHEQDESRESLLI